MHKIKRTKTIPPPLRVKTMRVGENKWIILQPGEEFNLVQNKYPWRGTILRNLSIKVIIKTSFFMKIYEKTNQKYTL